MWVVVETREKGLKKRIKHMLEWTFLYMRQLKRACAMADQGRTGGTEERRREGEKRDRIERFSRRMGWERSASRRKVRLCVCVCACRVARRWLDQVCFAVQLLERAARGK